MKPPAFYTTRCIVIFAAVLGPFGSRGQAEPFHAQVTLGVDGINAVRNLPVLVAKHVGCFADEGLEVQLQETAVNAQIDAQLAEGRLAGMVAYYHHTVVAQSEGRDCQAVITLAVTPGYELLVSEKARPQIHGLADMKGRRVIAGGPHSAKSTTANMLALHAGFDPKDFERLAPTNKNSIAAALKAGEADFVICPEPDASFYRSEGVASLYADLYSAGGTQRSLGSLFPSTVLYMSTPYLAKHPELAQHLVAAFARALQYINSHSAAELIAAVPEMAAGENRESSVLEKGRLMFATDGRLDPAAARTEVKAIAVLFPEYAKVDLAKTFTNQYIDRVLKQ